MGAKTWLPAGLSSRRGGQRRRETCNPPTIKVLSPLCSGVLWRRLLGRLAVPGQLRPGPAPGVSDGSPRKPKGPQGPEAGRPGSAPWEPHGGLGERGEPLRGSPPSTQQRCIWAGPGPSFARWRVKWGGLGALGGGTPTHHAPAPGLGSWTFSSTWGPSVSDLPLSPQPRWGTG